MSDNLPDPAISELAGKILQQMLEEAEKGDLCPHCVGLDLIYYIAREMTAYTETDPGELFRIMHIGIVEGEDLQGEGEGEKGEDDDSGPSWTVH
jgi:hypothetical protein